MRHVLIIDGLNLIHRARVAMQESEHGCTFAALRSVRSLVDRFKPDVAYFVMEGVPRKRIEASEGTYKAQRVGMDDAFRNQKRQITDIISRHLPVIVTRHPDYEADDVIAHLATHIHASDRVTIVSTDSDFTQLLSSDDRRISLYSPIKDIFVEAPPYDYVRWKALRGDGADNIPGIPGIGDKRATNLVMEAGALEAFFTKKPETRAIFEHNLMMIGFEDLTETWNQVTLSEPTRQNDDLRSRMQNLSIASLTSDKTWPKWVASFDRLWIQFPSQAA
jgi:DNA polymerase-1